MRREPRIVVSSDARGLRVESESAAGEVGGSDAHPAVRRRRDPRAETSQFGRIHLALALDALCAPRDHDAPGLVLVITVDLDSHAVADRQFEQLRSRVARE